MRRATTLCVQTISYTKAIENFAERQNSISLGIILPEPVHPNLQIRDSMGSFSLSFKGLLLHLETLFDETGGDSCLKFLDSLEGVSPEKRRAFLSACTKVLTALKESKEKAPFEDNEEKLIETLCSQILDEIKKPELSVISGGSRSKTARRGKLIPILN